MRRMIIQNDYVNEETVAVEPVIEGVTVRNYTLNRIGNMVFGYIEFQNSTGGVINANINFIKVSGVPQSSLASVTCPGSLGQSTTSQDSKAYVIKNSADGEGMSIAALTSVTSAYLGTITIQYEVK